MHALLERLDELELGDGAYEALLLRAHDHEVLVALLVGQRLAAVVDAPQLHAQLAILLLPLPAPGPLALRLQLLETLLVPRHLVEVVLQKLSAR